MRKIINPLSLIIIIIALFFVFSCKNERANKFKEKNVSEFLNVYFNEWNKGNLNVCIARTHGTDTLSKDGLKRLKSSLNKGRDQLIEKNGGIAKVELVNLKALEEKNKMIANYNVYYVNGGGMKISRYVILQDDKFKLSLHSVE